jgi:hypothetical protein
MRRAIYSLLIFCALAATLQAASVYSSDGGKAWGKFRVKLVKPTRPAEAVNEYGGSEEHKIEASGFFQCLEKDGRWWMVDPAGHYFIMKGLNSVQAKRVGRSDSKAWAKETYELMRAHGFNTLGRWSDEDAFQEAGVPMPWCSTTSFMKDYDKQRSSENGESGFVNETLPVFDKEWPEFCATYAQRKVADLKDDPWLIGHFSDNEIPFRPDALGKYLELPKEDAGHKAVLAWMRENKVKESDISSAKIQQEFLEHMARLYFETVAAALKKADPNHLYLGSRLHGRCINPATITAAGACDIISVNYYHRWEPEQERLANWEEWSGRPFFVSEFYAMKVAEEDTPSEVGAGFRVMNVEDAVAFYHTHTVSLLENVPSCVGWHWFKYADDVPEYQKGIVSHEGEVHQTLLDGMKIVNEQAYTLHGL